MLSGMTDQEILAALERVTGRIVKEPSNFGVEMQRGIIANEAHKRNLIGMKVEGEVPTILRREMFIVQFFDEIYQWMGVGETAAEAKQVVFNCYNTHQLRAIEWELLKTRKEITIEQLDEALLDFYRQFGANDVTVDALDREWGFEVIEISSGSGYRDGYRVPQRLEDL